MEDNSENKSEMDFGVDSSYSVTQKQLAERIRYCAKLAGSGDLLAEKSGIPRRTLESYLSGSSEPKAARLAAIVNATGVSAKWLLTGLGVAFDKPNQTSDSSIEQEFALIPGYSVQVSAGSGAFPDSEQPSRRLAFRHKWLRFRGLNEKDLVLVFAKGDSMEPTIEDNNTLMIDTSQRELNDGSIYVIRTNDHLIVKRVQRLLNQALLLISDNRSYQPIQVNLGTDDLQVIGRVVWIGKDV
ncbi:MAG: XRE family transcriptional regulator [Nitrincola lacisaponensis]|uniref:XRE family transcriptional regulator n=1 Tax=Nitrincola lacisaponensis TaxID=267850 RepID=UPI00391DD87E